MLTILFKPRGDQEPITVIYLVPLYLYIIYNIILTIWFPINLMVLIESTAKR